MVRMIGSARAPGDDPVVPPEIARHRGKKAMVDTTWGEGNLLEAIEAAIAAIPDDSYRKKVEIEFADAPNIVREGNTTLAIMAAIGMTPEQRDALFLYAQTLP